MFKFLETESVFKKILIGVFLISLAYWGYLVFSSSMQISQDAIVYKQLGMIINQKGWVEYFKTGPNREALYPFLVATSMKIGEFFSISYQLPQKIIQVIFLLITQILIFLVLKKLKINNTIKLITLLYFGFSPAIVNAGFSLYSEILVLPLLPAAALLGIRSWETVPKGNFRSMIGLSIATTGIFLLIVFTKIIFQYVFLFFLLPFIWVIIRSLRNGKKKIFLNSLVYFVTAIFLFSTSVVSYKLINKKFNGNFVFTDRCLEGVFGSVAWRAEKLTFEKFATNLALISGTGVCRLFFTEKECQDCEYHLIDYQSQLPLLERLENTPKEKIGSETLLFSFRKAAEKPFQQLLFIGCEILKVPFWESTQIGFVIYPEWLQKIFDFWLFKNGLRLTIAILTCFAIFSLTVRIFKSRYFLFNFESGENREPMVIFFIFLIIASHAILHSIFLIITRYLLPVTPLYIIVIAYFLHNKINERKFRL